MAFNTRTKILFGVFIVFAIILCLATFLPENTDGNSLRIIPTNDDSLLWIKLEDNCINPFLHTVDRFLHDYKTAKHDNSAMTCNFTIPPKKGHYCRFEPSELRPCTKEQFYGYKRYRPCLFLILQTKSGWQPDTFDSTNDLPDEMPSSLKRTIEAEWKKEPNGLYSDVVWVTCEGNTKADAEQSGPIQYIPRKGFTNYHFKGSNSEGYLAPIVSIYLQRAQKNVIINMTCKAWARNINRNPHIPYVSSTFTLIME